MLKKSFFFIVSKIVCYAYAYSYRIISKKLVFMFFYFITTNRFSALASIDFQVIDQVNLSSKSYIPTYLGTSLY